MADEHIRVSGDSTEATAAFASLRQELQKSGLAVASWNKQTEEANAKQRIITTTIEDTNQVLHTYTTVIDKTGNALIKQYTALTRVEESLKQQAIRTDRLAKADERRAAIRQRAIDQAHKQADAYERVTRAAQEEALWQGHAAEVAGRARQERMVAASTRGEIRDYRKQLAEEELLNRRRQQALENLIKTIQRKAFVQETTDQKSADNLRRSLQGIKDLDEATAKFGITWEGAFRLVLVQLIHQAVTNLLRAMREGVQTAIDFHIKVAEVMTIDPNQLPFQYWADGIKKLSDIYGTGILDQTEAAYQTLSNQVAKSGETFEFLATANELAIATVSDAQTAVNALTSVLNAYNLSLTEARQIAADYFMSVDLGRFRLNELADTIGTVAASAAQVGIPMRDLHAALDLMTIRGVTSSNAMTYMRNIIMRLFKPTGEMTKYFEMLGVETGEQAIRTYTLAGFMQRMMEVTKGASDEIAAMFNNIRSVTGALLFAGHGLADYTRIQEQFNNSLEYFNRAADIVLSDLGKRFRIEFEQIHNYFVKDVGISMLETIDKLMGGIENLDEFIKLLSKSIKYMLLPVLYGLTLQFRSLLLLLTKSPMGQFLLALSAVAAIFETIEHIVTANIRKEQEYFDLVVKNSEERVKVLQKEYQELTDNFTKALNDRQQLFDRYIAGETVKLTESLKEYIKRYKELEEQIEEVYKSINDAVKETLKSQKDLINQFTRDLQQLANIAKSIQRDLEQYILDTLLKAAEKFPQAQLGILQQQRAILEARQAAATDVGEIEELSRRIIDLVKRENDIMNIITGQYTVRVNTLNIFQEQLDLIERIRSEKEAILATEKLSYANEEAKEKVLTDTWNKIKKFRLDDALKIDDPQEFRETIEAQERLLEQFLKAASQVGTPIDTQIPIASQYFKLIEIKEAQLKKLELQQKAIEYNTARKEFDEATKKSSDIINLLNSLDKAKTQLFELLGLITKTPDPMTYYTKAMTLDEVIQEAKNEIAKMKTILDPTTQDILEAQGRQLRDIFKLGGAEGVGVSPAMAKIYEERIKALENLIRGIEALTTNLDKLGGVDAIDQLKRQEAASRAVIENLEKTVIDPQVRNAAAFQSAIANFDTAIDKLISYLESRKTFAVGGIAKGTDVVPAMLTPGEFVVNRAATQRFYSQLVAMNQGMQPRYMADGGEVTNVGGINVTVNAANTPEKTARVVVSEINRALHRRVINLRK